MWCASFWKCDRDADCWKQHQIEDRIICGDCAETMFLSAFEEYLKKYEPLEIVESVYSFAAFLVFMRSAEEYADRIDGINPCQP